MVHRSSSRVLQIGWAVSSLLIGAARAVPPDATISVTFGVYVPPIVRWAGPSGDRATFVVGGGAGSQESSRTFLLAFNVDVTLSARVAPFTNTENPADVLETEWKITDDSEGTGVRSGVLARDARPSVGYGNFVSSADFLRQGVLVTHQRGDGNVRFCVTARLREPREGLSTPAPSERYEATIVLTAIPQSTIPTERAGR